VVERRKMKREMQRLISMALHGVYICFFLCGRDGDESSCLTRRWDDGVLG
jgi:hypothetical protein